MKTQIVGIEVSEGVSKKSGGAYSIGTLHTLTALAPPFGGAENVAKGYAGDKFQCDVGLLRKVQHLSFPLTAEVTTQDVIRFGKREQIVTDIQPLEVARKAA